MTLDLFRAVVYIAGLAACTYAVGAVLLWLSGRGGDDGS